MGQLLQVWAGPEEWAWVCDTQVAQNTLTFLAEEFPRGIYTWQQHHKRFRQLYDKSSVSISTIKSSTALWWYFFLLCCYRHQYHTLNRAQRTCKGKFQIAQVKWTHFHQFIFIMEAPLLCKQGNYRWLPTKVVVKSEWTENWPPSKILKICDLNLSWWVRKVSDTVSRADGRVSDCWREKQTKGSQTKYLLNEGQKC